MSTPTTNKQNNINRNTIAFGPVPSRRLGQSLGINNIPPKACSYDCIYCQVGPTTDKSLERRGFYAPEDIKKAVSAKLEESRKAGAKVDYLSFVPDGEPTLDIHLGKAIRMVKPFGIPVAVFTNSSLINRPDVQAELALADWVSLKVDAVHPATWRKINRPNKDLDLTVLLEGMKTFAGVFQGELVTETMLVDGINDDLEHLRSIAGFLSGLSPHIAYIGVPTRPPIYDWVKGPDEASLHQAYQIFAKRLPRVEYLIGFSEAGFQATGDPVKDILNITAVHPMRESEVKDYLRQTGAEVDLIGQLVKEEKLVRVEHGGELFYIRKFSKK